MRERRRWDLLTPLLIALAVITILAFLEHEYGVWHPIGGCNMLMRKMAGLAGELGATLRLSEPVVNIEFDGDRVSAVATEHGRYEADAVVLNADFA